MKLILGAEAKNKYAIHISIPTGIIELKGYCKLHGGVVLTDAEISFARSAGLDELIKSNVVAIEGEVKVVAPKAEVKAVVAPKVVKEVKAEEVAVAPVVAPIAAPVVEVSVDPVADAVVEDSTENADTDSEAKGKTRRKRS